MTGILAPFFISFNAFAASISGTAHRIISQPAFSSSFISVSVDFTSLVSVFVMDWTDMGASPPTFTSPTKTGFVTLRI